MINIKFFWVKMTTVHKTFKHLWSWNPREDEGGNLFVLSSFYCSSTGNTENCPATLISFLGLGLIPYKILLNCNVSKYSWGMIRLFKACSLYNCRPQPLIISPSIWRLTCCASRKYEINTLQFRFLPHSIPKKWYQICKRLVAHRQCRRLWRGTWFYPLESVQQTGGLHRWTLGRKLSRCHLCRRFGRLAPQRMAATCKVH